VPRRSARRNAVTFEGAGRLAAAIGEHPRESVALIMVTVAIFAIVLNALFLQKGPHPAPIFAARPLLPQETTLAPRLPGTQPAPAPEASNQGRLQLIANIQRELSRKGFYDGPADGIWGAKTDTAVRDFLQTAGLKTNAEASDGLLRAITTSNAKPASTTGAATPADPIGKLIATPSKRITAVQRALADFGYGQIKPTGIFDADTKAAVERFERERRLPIDGQMSDRFVRELAAMTGRPLE
jgi:peptidoglycan hydrolase-like protein with peptidoglycan-binding domain